MIVLVLEDAGSPPSKLKAGETNDISLLIQISCLLLDRFPFQILGLYLDPLVSPNLSAC